MATRLQYVFANSPTGLPATDLGLTLAPTSPSSLLIAQAFAWTGAEATATIPGWTRVDTVWEPTNDNPLPGDPRPSSRPSTALFWKVADGSETTVAVNAPFSTAGIALDVVEYVGLDTTNPVQSSVGVALGVFNQNTLTFPGEPWSQIPAPELDAGDAFAIVTQHFQRPEYQISTSAQPLEYDPAYVRLDPNQARTQLRTGGSLDYTTAWAERDIPAGSPAGAAEIVTSQWSMETRVHQIVTVFNVLPDAPPVDPPFAATSVTIIDAAAGQVELVLEVDPAEAVFAGVDFGDGTPPDIRQNLQQFEVFSHTYEVLQPYDILTQVSGASEQPFNKITDHVDLTPPPPGSIDVSVTPTTVDVGQQFFVSIIDNAGDLIAPSPIFQVIDPSGQAFSLGNPEVGVFKPTMPGPHRVSAVANSARGQLVAPDVIVTVNEVVLPPVELVYSLSPDRSNPQPLNGALLEPVDTYVFVADDGQVQGVQFWINTALEHTELDPPWDLVGGGMLANPFNMSVLAAGEQIIEARVDRTGSGVFVLESTANFTVAEPPDMTGPATPNVTITSIIQRQVTVQIDIDAPDTQSVTVNWGEGDPVILPGDTSPILAQHTYEFDGEFTVTATARDAIGNPSAPGFASDSTDTTAPVIIWSVTPNFLDVDLTSQPIPADVTATVDWGDGSSEPLAETLSHSYAEADTYLVQVTAEDSANPPNPFADEKQVTVSEQAIIPTVNIEAVRSGLEVQFYSDAVGADEWDWNFGDGFGSTEESPKYPYAAPGEYPVTLLVTYADGLTSFAATSVIVTEDVVDSGYSGPLAAAAIGLGVAGLAFVAINSRKK